MKLYHTFSVFFLLAQGILAQKPQTTTEPHANQHHLDQKEVVQAFLNWYKDNYTLQYRYNMIVTDTSGNYQVDKTACSQYLDVLKSSGFISDEYLKLWNRYFDDQAEKFKINPQIEGPPEGFDFDLVLSSQEPEEVFKILEKLKFYTQKKSQNKSEIIVDTGWPDHLYLFELGRIKDRWFIDYISLKEPE